MIGDAGDLLRSDPLGHRRRQGESKAALDDLEQILFGPEPTKETDQ